MSWSRAERIQLDIGQIRALASPVREALLAAFMSHGPCSVNRLAQLVGKDPKSLYYQVRQLVRVGLLAEAGTQGSGTHRESLYDVVAHRLSFDLALQDQEYRNAVAESGAALIRYAGLEFEKAFQRPYDPDELPKSGRLRRFHLRITEEQLAELIERVRDLHDFADGCKGTEGPYAISLTTVMVPTQPASFPETDEKGAD